MTPSLLPHILHSVISQKGYITCVSPSKHVVHTQLLLGTCSARYMQVPQFSFLQNLSIKEQYEPAGFPNRSLGCADVPHTKEISSSVFFENIHLFFLFFRFIYFPPIIKYMYTAIACRLYCMQRCNHKDYFPHEPPKPWLVSFLSESLEDRSPNDQPIASEIASENSVVLSFVSCLLSFVLSLLFGIMPSVENIDNPFRGRYTYDVN